MGIHIYLLEKLVVTMRGLQIYKEGKVQEKEL